MLQGMFDNIFWDCGEGGVGGIMYICMHPEATIVGAALVKIANLTRPPMKPRARPVKCSVNSSRSNCIAHPGLCHPLQAH